MSLRESFDADELQTTWQKFQNASRRLALLTRLPLLWLIAVTPFAIVALGPLRTWPYLLGGLFASSLIVSIAFVRVHRRQLPAAADRWLHAVSMTLFPIASIRAVDRISKERVAGFNPLTVIAVFCGEDDADPLLRRCGFDLDRADAPAGEPAVASCREWYRAQKRAAFTELLKALQRNPFSEPAKSDETVALYCPRCHSQFEDGITDCADCEAVALVPFEERKRA
ncbi:MAG: hypothetical protein K2Y23_00310 [Cyanobacteria bacterium]|nr:hypothetical protein [Cyanobacteriota bacterium]